MSTILIGVDDSTRSEDAIAFGGRLADAAGAHVIVANAYPYSEFPSRAAGAAYREQLRDAAIEVARAMRDRLGLPESRCAVKIKAEVSPARALHSMAEVEDASLVIVGSTHTGRAARVLPGSTGERLIHGSPCAVAVVPKDYREQAGQIRTVGVAYNASPEARAAAFSAAELARALGAELVVIGVADALAYAEPALMNGPNAGNLRAEVDRQVEENLAALLAELPDGVAATAKHLVGDPAELLTGYSKHVDLLVVGSRGYGPVRSVLAGGVSGRVIRTAHCPVIIVPRGVERSLGGLFDGRSSAAVS